MIYFFKERKRNENSERKIRYFRLFFSSNLLRVRNLELKIRTCSRECIERAYFFFFFLRRISVVHRNANHFFQRSDSKNISQPSFINENCSSQSLKLSTGERGTTICIYTTIVNLRLCCHVSYTVFHIFSTII